MSLILIIDDDSYVRASLENFLASAGYATESFASGEVLLESLPQPEADCLLLDVRMRGMSGLDLQEQLTKLGNTAPVIFLTAHCDEETRARALKGGAYAFFSKPFDEEALLASIASAVNAGTA